MLYISRRIDFSAMHRYRVDSWTEEKNRQVFGPCSNRNGHGHDYKLEVMVKGKLNNHTGMVVNTGDIKLAVGNLIDKELDGKFLNEEHPYFKQNIPTAENIVAYLWEAISQVLENCSLNRLKLYENHYLFSEKEEGDMVTFTRRYHFSSAHRLHSDQLSDKENERIFGKCNNPYGHGHNYYLDVAVKGIPDNITGMVINMADLDEIVEKIVLEEFDHKHLNLDTAVFKGLNPTSEVMAKVVYDMLKPYIPKLYRIGVWETEKNYFEYINEEETVHG
ncbi:6-carboxytetrahydropterin synthase [Gracilibacillus ureilyticus]|uniref:6-carboxytetrahydropterin synthase n=1 Tax=Gracilibacillus ureilyticus TaxID=531814 RepID=UPI000B7FD793|nr:6-carboxytetrahydropterin synthase [Gracilibacillus ureilyticus]